MKYLVVLRTNIFSRRWYKILKLLPDNYQVIIVADQKSSEFTYKDMKTVNYTDEKISDLGLMLAADMQWRFGDYVLYLADAIVDDYEYIWLIEPDVHINKDNATSFFDKFDSCTHDLLSSYFSISDKDWMWNKYIESIGHEVGYKTFFPLIRISKKAVRYLLQQRRKFKSLANDELFVATMLHSGNFEISTFRDEANITYDKNYFSYRLPHYLPIIKMHGSSEIYHPAFDSFNFYIKHLIFKKSWRSVVKRFLGNDNHD